MASPSTPSRSRSAAPPAIGVAPRLAALRLLDAVLRRGLPVDAAQAGALRDVAHPPDRALAHAIVAEVLRHLPDLDRLIDGATAKPLPDDAKARMALRIALAQALVLHTPPHAAVSTVLPLVDGGPRRLVHGVFSAVLRAGPTLPSPPTLPAPVAARWEAAWGDEAVTAARFALAAPPLLDITLADPAATAQWAERLGGTSIAPGHLRLPRGTVVTDLPGFAEGAWWVQDIAASLPARVLGEGNGRRLLDLCAAPGGKAMQLAAAGWRVTALDSSADRLARLRANLDRTGLHAELVTADVMRWQPAEPADAVLLDAPCSATGVFRRHPDVLHRATTRSIAQLADGQRRMLARAAAWVKPGGTLVYAVCSLEPQEAEAVVRGFDGHGLQLEAITSPVPALPATADGLLRVLPGALADRGGADGFFVARWRRHG